MKEEKMEVTIAFASSIPVEQSQSRFKSLEFDFYFKNITTIDALPDSPYKEQDAG